MRRYRGADKPPGSTLSPPPYSRNAASRSSARHSTGGSAHRPAVSGLTSPMSENELFMMHNSVTANAAFLDPRTKKPMIPPAGRTIPKLKMADLTSSLAPLVESHMTQQHKSPITVADKEIADVFKEVTTSKDMLESFDDAIKIPDMRSINARVAHLRKEIGPSSNHNASKGSSSTRQGSNSLLKTKTVSSDARKPNASKVSPKNEEQNIRKLMGQLKDKYLDDMESQLGLAIERRPRAALAAESLNENSSQEQGVGGSRNRMFEVGIPRPSTNASEITSRIDKVVREWATESQKLSTVMKVPTSSKQLPSASGMTKINNYPSTELKPALDINGNIIENDRQKTISNNSQAASNVAPGKNKNLARISTAFRKSLDPISKRDVRELIRIPEDDHIEKLEQEHEERRRAHESIFKNAMVSTPDSPVDNKGAGTSNKKGERKANKAKERNKQTSRNTTDDGETGSESTTVEQNRTKSSLVTPKPKPRTLVKKGEDEVYNIIQEHMEYENAGGPPKLTKTRKPAEMVKNQSSKTAMLRSDAVGKALLKYSDSHKKLQTVVNSFTEKVDIGANNRPGPTAHPEDSEQSGDDEKKANKPPATLPVASVVNVSTVNSRRRNASEASSTLSRSMKTIDRASSVAQRLGTLMSRVALRNEAYEYEKQQEAQLKSSSAASTANEDESVITPQSSIKSLSTAPLYERHRPNPYEMTQSLSNSRSEFERPSVAHGVSKLDSSHFGKYVEEMKKVAEKAAESFEKFKLRQVKNDLTSEEETSESEYNYKGNGEAAAVAAAAAEIAAIQEQEKKRKTTLQRTTQSKQSRKPMSRNSPKKLTNMSDAGTSPREPETAELLSKINRNYGSDSMNDNNNKQGQFKFVPDMSYTDQLMLQKLRKLKENEGWEGAEDESVVGDVPEKADLESMIKRSTNMNLPREPERASMGPISVNAILRSRLNRNDNGNK